MEILIENDKTTEKPWQFKKGNHLGQGCPKGIKQEINRVREAMFEVLRRKGGIEYILRYADKNPKHFMELLFKLIPTESKVEVEDVTNRDFDELRKSLVERFDRIRPFLMGTGTQNS